MNAQLNSSLRKIMASGAGAYALGYELDFRKKRKPESESRGASMVFASPARAGNYLRPCGGELCGGVGRVQKTKNSCHKNGEVNIFYGNITACEGNQIAGEAGFQFNHFYANSTTTPTRNPAANIVPAAIIARLSTNPILRNQAQKTTHSTRDKLSPTGIVELTSTKQKENEL
jgi:hypothetical protein